MWPLNVTPLRPPSAPNEDEKIRRSIIALLLLTTTFTPNVFAEASSETDTRLQPDVFPEHVDEFQRIDVHKFDNPVFGYAIKYETPDSEQIIDVYIFPVDPSIMPLDHEKRVAAYLGDAQRGIVAAVDVGMYKSSENHGVYDGTRRGALVLKSTHTIQHKQRKMYSAIYVTERNGTVIKLRKSVEIGERGSIPKEFDSVASELIDIALRTMELNSKN